MTGSRKTFDLVVAANRLPVDKQVDEDGNVDWQRSPGGLVTAMESVMQANPGPGWAGPVTLASPPPPSTRTACTCDR